MFNEPSLRESSQMYLVKKQASLNMVLFASFLLLLVLRQPGQVVSQDYTQLLNLFKIFSRERSLNQEVVKESVRVEIKSHFKKNQLTLITQDIASQIAFDDTSPRLKYVAGQNIIGILQGRNKKDGLVDPVIVLAAHYDSYPGSPGVNDGGSGMVALLELARRVAKLPESARPCTLIFVALDLHFQGFIGASSFLRYFLLPRLKATPNVKVLGAYIFDSLLIHNEGHTSSIINESFRTHFNYSMQEYAEDQNRANFLSVWMRPRSFDRVLFDALWVAWTKEDTHFLLKTFDYDLDEDDSKRGDKLEQWMPFIMTESANFWYFNLGHFDIHYPQSGISDFPAVTLSDMGMWREPFRECYHQPCDNGSFLTTSNLNFLFNTINAMQRVILTNPPSFKADAVPYKLDVQQARIERIMSKLEKATFPSVKAMEDLFQEAQLSVETRDSNVIAERVAYGSKDTPILVIAASYGRYNTVQDASGLVALLALPKEFPLNLPFNIIFVALARNGTLDFIDKYLAERRKDKSINYLGSIFLDTLDTYDIRKNTQYLPPRYLARFCGSSAASQFESRGNFLAIHSRTRTDKFLVDNLVKHWSGYRHYHVVPFARPDNDPLLRYWGPFGDEEFSLFWSKPIKIGPAVFITDLKQWRGKDRQCMGTECSDSPPPGDRKALAHNMASLAKAISVGLSEASVLDYTIKVNFTLPS